SPRPRAARALLLASIATAGAWTACASPPAVSEACRTINSRDLSAAVGRPVRQVDGGFVSDGPPSNLRGCEYAVGDESWISFEAWVDKQTASKTYVASSRDDARPAADLYRDE